MPAIKQRLARIGASAGVLAATTAAIMAVGGAGASIASAACPGAEALSIQGRGSSLQRVAQENWTGRKVPTTEGVTPYEELAGPIGYARTVANGGCSEAPVSYTSTSSGSGLTAFRFNGSGSVLTQFAFVGTDDGPTRAQIENAESATSNTARPVIVPVAETSIAVVVNPPANCEFVSKKGISWTQLNQIFAGTLKTWEGLKPNVTGTGCTSSAPITRVVREDGSGTTYQFKNYLSALETEHAAAGPGCGLGTWASLEAIGAEEKPNVTWPKTGCEAGVELSNVVAVKGGGGVAETVQKNAGYIGYASLPDAKGKSAAQALLQDKTTEGEAVYAAPAASSGETSNCGARVYTVPAAAGTEPGGREGESGVAVNWSKVFGASPAVGGGLYPLCTLTYDVAWNNYANAGYTEGSKVAKNVKSYLEYVLGTGQSVGKWYQALPQPGVTANNVLGAAKLAITNVS